MKELERKWEERERDDRRKNVLLKGLREGEKILQEKVKEVLKRVTKGEMKIEEMRRIRAGRKDRGEMVIVKMKNEEVKRRIMRNKWKLREEEVWIEEDLTWEERRRRWKMRQFALNGEMRGKKILIS